MYQLVVVSGRNRGTVYPIHRGDNWLGRQEGNEIVLQSSRISKRHCLVRLGTDGVLEVRDNGSQNGTFVNGEQTRGRELRPGDRLSLGDFVLQVVQPSRSKRRSAPPAVFDSVQGQQDALMFQQGGAAGNLALAQSAQPGASLQLVPNMAFDPAGGSVPSAQGHAEQVPKFGADPKGWILFHFEKFVMPFFYSLGMRQEWRGLAAVVIGTFVVLNLVISVQPLLESSRTGIVREVMQRARFMAREIADRNSPVLASRTETKAEIGAPENAAGVRLAMLTDLDMRIIAPSAKLNQYLTYGAEAQFVAHVRDRFRTGQQNGVTAELDGATVIAVEPVMVLSTQAGRNIPMGLAVVSIDTTLSTATLGEMGVVYSETLILTGLLALVMGLILYRISLKPFEVLSDDLDKALKGDLPQVTHEFKLMELDPLWDMINSAVQRIPKGSVADPMNGASESGVPIDHCVAAFQAVGELPGSGGTAVVVCGADQKILYMNARFEEISGIRADAAIGQDIPSVARDQALGALFADLFARAMPGAAALEEDFEFAGVSYKVRALALGGTTVGTPVNGYVMVASKVEGG